MPEVLKVRRRRSKHGRDLPAAVTGPPQPAAESQTLPPVEAVPVVEAPQPAAESQTLPPVEAVPVVEAPQPAAESQTLPPAEAVHEPQSGTSRIPSGCKDDAWDCALLTARTANGQSIQAFAVVDNYSQECLSAPVGVSVSLEDVIDCLFDLFVLREIPGRLLMYGVPRPISEGVAEWLRQLPLETVVADGGRLEGDPGVFAAALKEDALGSLPSASLPEARTRVANWRRHYNETRPQWSPLEDEPQASESSGCSGGAEADPSVGQTLPPKEEPLEVTEASDKAAEKSWAPPGWDSRMPRWARHLTRAAEFAAIVVVVVLLTAVVLALIAPHFGWRADTVLSGSMEPALPVGSVEVTRPVSVEDIEVGDIITFRSPTDGQLMSHRVVAVEQGESYGFRTKGDKNEDVDPYVIPAENVVGRYCFKVDHAGRAVEYLKTPLGFILLGLFGLALIVAEISTMLEVRWREAARADTKAK